jgi:hypothetical protein
MGQCLLKDRDQLASSVRGAQGPQSSPGPREDPHNLISTTAQRLFPDYAQQPMTREVLEEFASALHRGFGDTNYGITGAAALAEYGMECDPVTLDVIVPSESLDFAKAKLLRANAGFLSLDADRSRSEYIGLVILSCMTEIRDTAFSLKVSLIVIHVLTACHQIYCR